jgi:hypothetical protein
MVSIVLTFRLPYRVDLYRAHARTGSHLFTQSRPPAARRTRTLGETGIGMGIGVAVAGDSYVGLSYDKCIK